MVKQKRVRTRSISGKKKQKQSLPHVCESDEGDWIVVKKQRITILIPPLPNKVQPEVSGIGEVELPENPPSTNGQSQMPLEISASKPSVSQTEALPVPSSPELVLPPLVTHPNETSSIPPEPSSLPHLNTSGNSLVPGFIADNERAATCSTATKGTKVCIGSSASLDRRIRAVYLDKKLKKAGGLKYWLSSLGLTCFLKLFENRRANTFQLVRLDMKKLKDMGADAIGPRRKLMHAIDCLCDPHCFQRSQHCS